MLLRFLHRDYNDVFRLADSVATDTNLNSEGQLLFNALGRCNDDRHPDAHACRLKISLVTIDSGSPAPWDLTIECARHVVKLDSVSSSCRLAPEEELQLLESGSIATSTFRREIRVSKQLRNTSWDTTLWKWILRIWLDLLVSARVTWPLIQFLMPSLLTTCTRHMCTTSFSH